LSEWMLILLTFLLLAIATRQTRMRF